jgi:hypothetical protein
MRVINKLSIAALAGSVALALSAGAHAQDHWDRDHYNQNHYNQNHYDQGHYDHHYDHYDRYHPQRFAAERPIYVAPRPPIVVAPPVMMAPPVVMAPPGPPSLNLNLNMPL